MSSFLRTADDMKRAVSRAIGRIKGLRAGAIFLMIAMATCASADVTNVRQNLDKYWAYRSMQRTYFIKVGVGQGCSMPACWRNIYEQQMNWGDSTLDTGWYIAALATEHYMLSNPGLFPGYVSGGGDLNTVRNELQYALAALDRVDATAEGILQSGYPDTPGFFIRDDVPDDFYTYFPGMTNILSDYTNPDWWAKEMSQDQVCHVLMGLALVKKLIPSDLVVNGMNLRSAAINRGADIVDWVHQHGWIIYDPVFNIPVNRGEDARAYGKGFAKVGAYLTDGAEDWSSTVSSFYQWVWDTLSDPANPGYDNYNNRHMAMVISASGNGWGSGTLNALMSLSDPYDWYAYPLLYAVLHNPIPQSQGTWAGHQATINSVVQNQLNLAPASGPHEPTTPEEETTGWGADRKFIRDLNSQLHGGSTDGHQYPGLDYLVLHNLYYIVTPSLWEDPTPPGQASNPNPANSATGVGISADLSWSAGTAATSHDVYFGTSNPPAFIRNQAGTTYDPGTLSESTTYYWRIDEKNTLGTTTGSVWSFVTAAVPPAPVTNLAVIAGDCANTLSWTNPNDPDYAGTVVRYSTIGYPGSPTGGESVYSGTASSTTHTGLCNGVTYYYSLFSFDQNQNYAAATVGSATPSGPSCYSDSFVYSNGALNGNAGWTGSATADQIQIVDGAVKLLGGAGSYDAVKSLYCQNDGSGYIPVSIKVYAGVGGRTIWNLWINDANGLNLARWYGTANSARGRIGETSSVTAEQPLQAGWNTLLVKVYPASNTSEFFFNGNSIGTLSHASQGAGDIVGRLSIQRIDNPDAVGHYLYFDDLQVGADTTPPGPVTNFLASIGDAQTNLSWVNPGDADFAGTMIRFKTSGYPVSPTDGTLCYNGSGTSFNHTGLTNGVTYYYSAYARDEVPNYSTVAHAIGPLTLVFCFRDTFSYSNGALVGQGGWTGNATSSHIEVVGGYIRIWGGPGTYYATKTVSCSGSGGHIWVRCNVNGETGDATMWSLRVNDPSGANLARWYGTGTTARGRIGDTASVTPTQTLSGAWQELAVHLDTTANTSEFFFNGNSIGTLSHASQGAGDSVGQIRFERVDNSNAPTQHLYFDDIRVGAF